MDIQEEIRRLSNKFHHNQKGCVLEPFRLKTNNKKVRSNLACLFCKTHQVNLCRCGWEWKWHFGGDLSKIK